MTHAELVIVAVRWLKRTVRCSVVLAEPQAVSMAQSPDAIGWRSADSYMVECKISRADFRADQKKHGRSTGPRLARHCYYLTPPRLVQVDELPAKWGLLETDGGVVRVVRKPSTLTDLVDDRPADDVRHELSLLWAELRRYHAQGISYQTMTGHPAQAHLSEQRALLELAAEDDVREARRVMGLEPRGQA